MLRTYHLLLIFFLISFLVGLLLFQYTSNNQDKSSNNQDKSSNNQDINVLKFVGFIDEKKLQEVRDIDERKINNTEPGEITISITASQEWSKTYSIGYEEVNNKGAEVNLGFSSLDIKGKTEQELKKRFDINEQIKKINTDAISIKVPPKTKSTLSIVWINHYQTGKIIYSQNNSNIFIPYKVLYNVTYNIDKDFKK